jgi:hypothetical protein
MSFGLVASFGKMRPGMRWALGLSLLVSGMALLPTSEKPEAAVAIAMAQPSDAAPGVPASPPIIRAVLPGQLAVQALERAERDPFELPAPPPVAAPVAPPAPPPPAPPSAPALNYRYLGQLLDLQGQRRVYLARSDGKEVMVERGTRLDEGYLVEAITPAEIKLVYEALQQRLSIPIPISNPS